MTEIAPIITALGSLVGSLAVLLTVLLSSHRTQRKVDEVKHEVKTSNAQTMADLLDATETRRIEEKPEADRTPLERDHISATEDREV